MKATNCLSSIKDLKITSPIGDITIAACSGGLHKVFLDPEINDDNFNPDARDVSVISCNDEREIVAPARDAFLWFRTYFNDPRLTNGMQYPSICFASSKANFRSQVWQTLQSNVPAGDTITYKELAILLSKPGAARSVGSAMKNNPICILVPCHRVLKTTGLGLYHGGQRQKVKRWLLEHEGCAIPAKQLK